MKLSTSIRLGAALKPQHPGDLFGTRRRLIRKPSFPWFGFETVDTSCALGAAYEAHGVQARKVIQQKGEETAPFRGRSGIVQADRVAYMWAPPPEWLGVFYELTACPQCGQLDHVYAIVTHLNDRHRWTRERIAAWVEELEQEIDRDAESTGSNDTTPQGRKA